MSIVIVSYLMCLGAIGILIKAMEEHFRVGEKYNWMKKCLQILEKENQNLWSNKGSQVGEISDKIEKIEQLVQTQVDQEGKLSQLFQREKKRIYLRLRKLQARHLSQDKTIQSFQHKIKSREAQVEQIRRELENYKTENESLQVKLAEQELGNQALRRKNTQDINAREKLYQSNLAEVEAKYQQQIQQLMCQINHTPTEQDFCWVNNDFPVVTQKIREQAFNLYVANKANRDAITTEKPGIDFYQLRKELASKWRSLSDTEKEPYINQAVQSPQ